MLNIPLAIFTFRYLCVKILVNSFEYYLLLNYLQVIGNGTRAEGRSVLLVTDHTHYLFNCGEGTQRLSTEHRTKISKIEHIFVTKPSWNNLGGIPGLALTIQDTGVPKLTLHGPDGLIDLIEASKQFVILNSLEVDSANICEGFTDQVMCVEYVPIKNPKIQKLNEFVAKCENVSLSESVSELKSKTKISTILSYICKIHPKLGTLDIKKCKDAGIVKGPNLGKLKNGEDITLDDGTVIRSTDVVSPSEPGPIFIGIFNIIYSSIVKH